MNYSTYFQSYVLDELLDHPKFWPMCVSCSQQASGATEDYCLDCIPYCSLCNQQQVMGDYTDLCVDCYWEEDYNRKRQRRSQMYANKEICELQRKQYAAALGVAYVPLSETERKEAYLRNGGNPSEFCSTPKLRMSSLVQLSLALRSYMREWKENKDMESWCHSCDYDEKECISSEEEYISCSECGSDCRGSDWESYRFCSRRCMSRYSRRYDRW